MTPTNAEPVNSRRNPAPPNPHPPSPRPQTGSATAHTGATIRRKLEQGFLDHIEQADFPCVGAKAALAQGGLTLVTAGSITGTQDDARLHRRLVHWAKAARPDAQSFFSLAAIFAGPHNLDERGFEAALWDRLNRLSKIDRAQGHRHDPGFSDNPHDPHFALSFGGKACFAVGLHPHASRRARRTPSPVIVFNLHQQFTALREADRYERMREVILDRDTQFDGTPNPMIARHGEISEARQYSGRAVADDWVCPFALAQRDQ
jgi:FPC/CPF motif-containing protein YcgG